MLFVSNLFDSEVIDLITKNNEQRSFESSEINFTTAAEEMTTTTTTTTPLTTTDITIYNVCNVFTKFILEESFTRANAENRLKVVAVEFFKVLLANDPKDNKSFKHFDLIVLLGQLGKEYYFIDCFISIINFLF